MRSSCISIRNIGCWRDAFFRAKLNECKCYDKRRKNCAHKNDTIPSSSFFFLKTTSLLRYRYLWLTARGLFSISSLFSSPSFHKKCLSVESFMLHRADWLSPPCDAGCAHHFDANKSFIIKSNHKIPSPYLRDFGEVKARQPSCAMGLLEFLCIHKKRES